MASRERIERYCDRPGCDAKLKDTDERVFLDALGPASVMKHNEEKCSVINDSDPMARACSVDLCKDCRESLNLWWTHQERRKQAAT